MTLLNTADAVYMADRVVDRAYLGADLVWDRLEAAVRVQLFGAGEQGGWYDPSTLSSMYEDSTGRTPASVNGLVGLVLDRAHYDRRGVVNLLTRTNDFSNAAWTKQGTTIAVDAVTGPGDVGLMDTITDDTSTGYHTVWQVSGLVDGQVCARTITVKRSTSRYVTFGVAGATSSAVNTWIFDFDAGAFVATGLDGAGESVEALGDDTYRITWLNVAFNTNNNRLMVGLATGPTRGDTEYTGTSSLSVHVAKAQFERGSVATTYQANGAVVGGPGNHLSQPTTAFKPILRGTPVGGTMVVNGGFDTDTDWVKGTGWTISSGVANFATTGAASNLSQNIGLVSGRIYRAYVTVTVTAGSLGLYLGAGGTGLAQTITASGTYEVNRSVGADSTLYLQASTTFAGTVDNINVYDVSADVVQAPYFWQHDGIDDHLICPANVDFTATDKLTVWAGARKLSDTVSSNGEIFGIGSVLTTPGSAHVIAAGGTQPNFEVALFGTALCSLRSAAIAAPVSAVLTTEFDLAGANRDEAIVATINGAAAGSTGGSLTPPGGGTFGNLPIHIGRRGPGNPFFGYVFQAMLRAGQADAGQVAAGNAFTAQRTGVTLP